MKGLFEINRKSHFPPSKDDFSCGKLALKISHLILWQATAQNYGK